MASTPSTGPSACASPPGLVAVALTVLYAGIDTPEPPEQDEAREGAVGDA